MQAVKVAGVEDHAVAHFEQLNETRRSTTIRGTLLEEFVFGRRNRGHRRDRNDAGAGRPGDGGGDLHVGDSPFIFYLWFMTELPSYLGTFVGDIKQQEVADRPAG